MVGPEWVEEQMVYLTARIGIYRPDAREKFFFEPTGGFYGLIAQGSTEALNDGMRMLADHIECIGCPVVEGWEGQENPLVLADHDWTSDNEPPGLIYHTGPHHSRVRLAIVNKHSPLVLGAILAHELTHYYLVNKGIGYQKVEENEKLTDLAAVYLGLGKLVLNGYEPIRWRVERGEKIIEYTYRVGYLTPGEIATIMHSVCAFRHIPVESVEDNLTARAVQWLRETRPGSVSPVRERERTLKVRDKLLKILKRIVFGPTYK